MSDDEKTGGISPEEAKANRGCLVFIAIVLVALVAMCVNGASKENREARPTSSYTAPERNPSTDWAPPSGYEESTRESGITPSEAMAADLIICRETGQCPAGLTQTQARDIICRRVGDC